MTVLEENIYPLTHSALPAQCRGSLPGQAVAAAPRLAYAGYLPAANAARPDRAVDLPQASFRDFRIFRVVRPGTCAFS